MIIHAQHKRFDLAERHLHEIRRTFPSASVRMLRTNASGDISKRGTHYTYEVRNRKSKRTKVPGRDGQDKPRHAKRTGQPQAPGAAEPKQQPEHDQAVSEIQTLEEFQRELEDAIETEDVDIEGGVDSHGIGQTAQR